MERERGGGDKELRARILRVKSMLDPGRLHGLPKQPPLPTEKASPDHGKLGSSLRWREMLVLREVPPNDFSVLPAKHEGGR